MSSPFPVQPDPFSTRGAILIKERGTHIPSFYVPHTEPQTISVTVKGEPLAPGFTVADVAPERRWAIQPDGEVMEQLMFQNQHELWYVEWYSLDPTWNVDEPSMRPIPNVKEFVSYCVDLEDPKRLRKIGHDPHKPAPPRKELWSADGERSMSIEESEAQERAMSKSATLGVQLETLRDLKDQGVLSPEDYIEQIDKLTAKDSPQPAAPRTPPPEGFTRREDSAVVLREMDEEDAEEEAQERVVAKTGKKLSKRHQKVPALCGRKMAPQGMWNHVRACDKCKAIQSKADAIAAAGSKDGDTADDGERATEQASAQ